jgi:hypothetical protein
LLALRVLTRSTIGAGFEVNVAEAAFAAFGNDHFFLVNIEVGQNFSGYEVGNHGTDRHAQDDIVATGAVLIGAAAIFAALTDEFPGVTVVDQRIDVAVGNDVDAAAPATVTTVGSAQRDVFFAPERDRTVATIPGFDMDLCFVDEFHAWTRLLTDICLGRAVVACRNELLSR